MTKQFLLQVEMGADTRMLRTEAQMINAIYFHTQNLFIAGSEGTVPAVTCLMLVDKETTDVSKAALKIQPTGRTGQTFPTVALPAIENPPLT